MLVNGNKQVATHECTPFWLELHTITLHTLKYCVRLVASAGGVPISESSPTMNLFRPASSSWRRLGRPLNEPCFKGQNAVPFANEFHWGLNQAKEFVPTEVMFCQIPALLRDGGQGYCWEAYTPPISIDV